jgi:hypothetical protein
MATKKQQKRRHKRMVHEGYDHAPPAAAPSRREAVARDAQPDRGGRRRAAPARAPRGRAIPEPSLLRSARRGLFVYATLWLALGSGILGGKQEWASALIAALPAALLFIPFDYFLGGFMYRRFARRAAQAQAPKR